MTVERMVELLEIEKECVLRNATGECNRYCAGCDLLQDDSELHEMYTEAIALLKAQEPRVMTWEEVKAFEWDYCYLEQERQPGKEYRMIVGDYALTCITWPCITSMRIEHGDSSYGKTWRCWTSRPTDEQRQAVKWE